MLVGWSDSSGANEEHFSRRSCRVAVCARDPSASLRAGSAVGKEEAYLVRYPALSCSVSRRTRDEASRAGLNNFAQRGTNSTVKYAVEWSPHMETIQVVIDKKLLQATDQAARRTKRNRSALVRDALREHLRQIEIQGKEQRDREGYRKTPQERRETSLWEKAAAWPEE